MNSISPKSDFVDNNARVSRNAHEAIRDIFDQPHRYTAQHWPRSRRDSVVRANPYKFEWANEPVREAALQMICSGNSRKTDYPAKDVLRLMLYLWRAAEQRKNLPLRELKGYRWRWMSTQYLCDTLNMDKSMYKKVMARLIERDLVVRVYKAGQMGGNTGVSHFRPSDDLFRLCLKLTTYSDPAYIQATNYGTAIPTDQQMKPWRRIMAHAFTKHNGALREIVWDFVGSDDAGRARAMNEGIGEILTKCLDETGMSSSHEYEENLAGYYDEGED